MLDINPPRLYVNGFPKSGLHLAVRMALPMFNRASEETVWYGTNAWTVDRYNLAFAVDKFESIKRGTFLMGHTGYLTELQDLFNALQILMLLVYRDLRDVAVSQAHHIIDDKAGMLNHPGRHLYKTDDFDSVLMDVITGIEDFQGVIERWETYEPWMELPFVHPVRFENMIHKPEWVARNFFDWVYSIILIEAGVDKAMIDNELRKMIVAWMVSEMGHRELSPTFRRGKRGAWRREFKPEHVKAFKETDKNNVLLKLHYVKKADW